MEKIELTDNVKEKLGQAVLLWADENLEGKPAILANFIYFSLEVAFIKKIEEIEKNNYYGNKTRNV